MEDIKQKAIATIRQLKDYELDQYLNFLMKKDKELFHDKDILIAIAKSANTYGYYYRIARDNLAELGIDMRAELERLNKEEILQFIDDNPSLLDVVNITVAWWVEAIRKPFFKNFNSKAVSIEEEMFISFPRDKAKIEEKNNREFTPEKEEIFRNALTFEIINRIKDEGKCHLWVDNHACWAINKCIDKADLRVKIYLPKKADMMVTTTQIKMPDSKGQWNVVYDTNYNESNKIK